MKQMYIVYCEVINRKVLELALGERKYYHYYDKLIIELENSHKYDLVRVKDYSSFYLAFDKDGDFCESLCYVDRVLFSIGEENPSALMTVYKGISLEFNDETVHNAIAALHAGIQKQRRIVKYNELVETELCKSDVIKRQLLMAIVQKSLVILYQPKISLNRKIVGFEALLRLRDQDGTYYSTERVIKTAKEFNLMHHIDRFLIHRVIEDYKTLNQYYPDTTISINLTIKELELDYHLGLFKDLAKKNDFPLDKLYVEITQDEEIDNLSIITDILMSFKKLRIRLSIDDFGSKYNNFYRLQTIKYDEIKIDKSITDKYKEYPGILDYLSRLFVGLGYEVVIEGIETEEQFSLLPSLDNLFLQGYLYSKPISLKEIGNLKL